MGISDGLILTKTDKDMNAILNSLERKPSFDRIIHITLHEEGREVQEVQEMATDFNVNTTKPEAGIVSRMTKNFVSKTGGLQKSSSGACINMNRNQHHETPYRRDRAFSTTDASLSAFNPIYTPQSTRLDPYTSGNKDKEEDPDESVVLLDSHERCPRQR